MNNESREIVQNFVNEIMVSDRAQALALTDIIMDQLTARGKNISIDDIRSIIEQEIVVNMRINSTVH